MRNHIALVALLIPSLAWAGNTCTTTATGSNWSSSSHWSCTPSGTVPGNGDVAIISNNTTVDVNTAVGQSGPSIIAAASYPQPSLSQSAGGGSLPAGAYHANFTNVDSGGKESAIAYESGSFTLTASDTLIITMGALPAGVSSRNVYLTAAGGAAGSETLYATGVTTSTYNMTSASWTNGTTTQAAAAVLPVNNWAIQITGGSLTLATNVTLTVHGDVKQGNEGVTLDCGSKWMWDSSTSAGGTNNAYYDMMRRGVLPAEQCLGKLGIMLLESVDNHIESDGRRSWRFHFQRKHGLWKRGAEPYLTGTSPTVARPRRTA